MCMLHGSPGHDPTLWAVVGFFALSATLAIAAAVANRWFLTMKVSIQWSLAAVTWAVHLAVFIMVMSIM